MKKFSNDKELLSAYVDGELSPEEKIYIEGKIKTSLELQKDLADLKKLKEITSVSISKISDSPFFETRVLANINQNKTSRFNVKKWMPAITLTALTIGLMVLLKFNPNFINNLIEDQKTNLAGFYKENLRPLLYAADLTNEDIFNFAMYQQLPLDSSNKQILKLGSNPEGTDYFEIKKLENIGQQPKENNLRKFVAALNLNEKESRQIDSIINSYSDQIASLVLVNDKNSVAINPNLWKTRKAILADIISFAQSHAPENLNKIVPPDLVKLDAFSLARVVSESKNVNDNQYIFCTPDSIFKDNYVFDLKEFKKNMEKMETELKKIKVNVPNFVFNFDSVKQKNDKYSDKITKQFKVFADSNFVKVTVQEFNMPDMKFDENNLPNFDSIATIISEATKNIRVYIPPVPPVPFVKKDFDSKVNTKSKIKINTRTDVNLDSLLNISNSVSDSLKNKYFKNWQQFNDSLGKKFNIYSTDSLLINQNKELKKEMDNLRRELQKFREEMKNFDNKNQDKNKNDLKETKSGILNSFEI